MALKRKISSLGQSSESHPRKPPTFQHLPLNRAKKLKQAWVENAKIKSKWKAEKRREGMPTRQFSTDVDLPNEPKPEQESADEESAEEETEDIPRRSNIHPSRRHALGLEPEPDAPAPRPKTPTKATQKELSPEPAPDSSSSLRDLAREAYSRSSLHTYRSDPLNRRGRGRGRGRGGGGGAPDSRRGRGQPNMKLRMDVMLEKIKRGIS